MKWYDNVNDGQHIHILKSQKTVNSKDNGDKSSMPPPPTTPPVRKPSDSEPRELKRTVDKKQTSPAEKKVISGFFTGPIKVIQFVRNVYLI